MKMYTKGFTLIELLVVIAIIGILASTVLVSLQSARKRGNDARIISAVQQIRVALESEYSANNTYPSLVFPAANTYVAAYATLSTNIDTLVDDIVSQQNAGGVAGTVGYGANAGGGLYGVNSSVIIMKDSALANAQGSGYAIYAKLPSGSTFCIDSSGRTKNSATYPAGVPASGAVAILCQPNP